MIQNTQQFKRFKMGDNLVSKIWHLSHIHHTGRFLPKHKTAYPALFMIVLLVGIFIIIWIHESDTALLSVNGTYRTGILLTSIKSPSSVVSVVNNNFILKAAKYIWSGYGFAALMLVSFWLGEKKDQNKIKLNLE